MFVKWGFVYILEEHGDTYINDPCPPNSEPATPLFLVPLPLPKTVYALLSEETFTFYPSKLPFWISPLLSASVGLYPGYSS